MQAFILIFDECNLPHAFRPTCVNMMKQEIHLSMGIRHTTVLAGNYANHKGVIPESLFKQY